MAKNYARAKGRGTKGPPFSQFFHIVHDSENYARLPPRAVKLLLDVLRFYNGRNNGDISITWSTMRPLGWKSKDQLQKATIELEHHGFIKKSRQGGRHLCSLYALTFFSVDECGGKHELTPSSSATNEWRVTQTTKPVFKKSLPRTAGKAAPQEGAIKGGKVVELTRHTGQSGRKS